MFIQEIFYSFFSSLKTYLSKSDFSGRYVAIVITYFTLPTISLNDQDYLGKITFIGTQECGDLKLIFKHSSSCLSYPICVLLKTTAPSIESSILNYISSVIMYKRIYDTRLS